MNVSSLNDEYSGDVYCKNCNGTGKIKEYICSSCNGKPHLGPFKCINCGSQNAFRCRQRTLYNDEEENFVNLCEICEKENDEYWQDMWEEYYRNAL